MSAFDGDFDLLPLRSLVDDGPVPSHPTDDERVAAQDAAERADPFTWLGAGRAWRAEAVRFRRFYPGASLDDSAQLLATETAKRLSRAQGRALEAS